MLYKQLVALILSGAVWPLQRRKAQGCDGNKVHSFHVFIRESLHVAPLRSNVSYGSSLSSEVFSDA